MLKKIIFTIILAFALTAGHIHAAVSNEEKHDILAGLGITASVDFEKEGITTVEFLCAVSNMISTEPVTVEDATEFAIQRKIVSSVSEREKNSNITYERAVTIAVNAMGYTPLVSDKESVYDYIRVASELGLLKDVSGNINKDLDKTAFVNLLYNMTKTELFDVTLAQNGIGYEKNKEKTMLSYYKDIVVLEGKVTATYNTSLVSEKGVSEGKIEIDGYVFDIVQEYEEDLIGCSVKAYVQGVGDEDLILYISVDTDDTNVLELQSDEITKVDKDYSYLCYQYEDAEKEKKVKLSPALSVIYNGKLYNEYNYDDFVPETGSIKLVDTDDDEIYDIVHIKSYETIVVQSVTALYKGLTNKYTYNGAIKDLDLMDDDITLRVYKDGEKVSFGKIMVGDVLSVMQSAGTGEKLVTIYICNNKVDGRILYHDEDDKKIKIGEDEYSVSEVYYKARKYNDKKLMEFDFTQDQTFSLDVFGNVVFVDGVKHGGYKYMYLLKLKHDDFMETFYLRVLDTSGDWKTLTMNEKVRLNDGQATKAKTVFDLMGGIDCQPQLIMAKTNKDGLITGVKLAEDFSGYDPKKFTVSPLVSGTWKPQNRGFSLGYYSSDDAVMFVIPTKTEEKYKEDAYSVESGYFNSEYVTYTFRAYNTNDFYIPEAFVVEKVEKNSEMIFIVNGVEVGLDEDDNPRTKLKGALGNGIGGMSIRERETGILKDVNPGDLVYITIKEGTIEEVSTLHKKGDRKISFPQKPNSERDIFKGIVKRVDVENQMTVFDFGAAGEKALYTESTAFIQIYDSNTKQFVAGGIKDMEPGDFVLCQASWGKMKLIIIYKD